MYRSFRAIIKRHQYINEGEHVLAGVSGGVDSMVLAALLRRLQKELSFELALAHVNYGLRGDESDAQEKLVKDFAAANGLPCYVSKAALGKAAAKNFQSAPNFQSAAREFRYHYFLEVAQAAGAGKIAVAHHQDDQVETILAHLLRGASVRGLGGMRASRELKNLVLIRPLLEFSKIDLEKYAAAHGISFIEDSSNASPKYWRNRLRQELLPVVQSLRPKAFEKIVAFAHDMQGLENYLKEEAQNWLQNFAKKNAHGWWLPRPRWLALPSLLGLEILNQAIFSLQGPCKNLKRDHLLRCLKISRSPRPQGIYSLPAGLQFVRQGDNLCVRLHP